MSPIKERDKKLGQLLVARGRATGEQVLRAIMCQRSQGGRLGTCLLELGLVAEEHLLEALAEQHGVASVPIEELRYVPHEILDLVPPKIAERCRAVPFAATDRSIDVATLNANNLAVLDELRFCTNRRVRPYVASEARIFEALSKHYGCECPRRFLELVDRLNRTRYLWSGNGGDGPVEIEDSGLELVEEKPPDEVTWSDPDDALGNLDVILSPAARGPAKRESAVEAPPPPTEEALWGGAGDGRAQDGGQELRLQDIDLLFGKTSGPREVGEVLIRYLKQYFSRCVLFKVRTDQVTGWLAYGDRIDSKLFKAVQISLREPSVFLNLQQGAELHLGSLPPMPTHRQLVHTWGGEWPSECLVMPIRVGDRLVAAYYGDRAPATLGGLDLDEWKSLAAKVGDALELCILRKKLQAG